ncbi:hypothetical protein HK100_004435 [Physocladia obscura]|uniref:Uncharacterized protein n=1 Tax=Physocladia obscura TaxID=109957 RepID=A0AAD5ST32_9FUNG|nr:hypothetical protein HK100_004435 [Physocladia obscura]
MTCLVSHNTSMHLKKSLQFTLYSVCGLQGSAGTQWQTMWTAKVLSEEASIADVKMFVTDISDLATEHMVIYPNEAVHQTLLDLLVSKLTVHAPTQKKFSGVALQLSQNGFDSFQPLLVASITLLPGGIMPMNPGPTHYGTLVVTFIVTLQNVSSVLSTNTQLRRKITGKANKSSVSKTGTKTCAIHGLAIMAILSVMFKRNLVLNSNTASEIAAKNSTCCHICGKADHIKLCDCPVIKATLQKHAAKTAKSSGQMASAIIEPLSSDEEMGEADGSDNEAEMINAVANSASHKGKTKAVATHAKSILKQQSGKTHKGDIVENAPFVPDLTEALGSITSLVNGTHDAVYFHNDSVYLQYHDTGKDVLIDTCVGDLFYLQMSDHTSKDPFAAINPCIPGSSTGEDSNDENSVGSAILKMNVSKTSKLIKSSQSNHVPL